MSTTGAVTRTTHLPCAWSGRHHVPYAQFVEAREGDEVRAGGRRRRRASRGSHGRHAQVTVRFDADVGELAFAVNGRLVGARFCEPRRPGNGGVHFVVVVGMATTVELVWLESRCQRAVPDLHHIMSIASRL